MLVVLKSCAVLCIVTRSCLALCDPMGYSPPASSVHGTLQARILEWVALFPPGDLPDPGVAGGLFATEPRGSPVQTLNSDEYDRAGTNSGTARIGSCIHPLLITGTFLLAICVTRDL